LAELTIPFSPTAGLPAVLSLLVTPFGFGRFSASAYVVPDPEGSVASLAGETV
jgi:hypothetical protein